MAIINRRRHNHNSKNKNIPPLLTFFVIIMLSSIIISSSSSYSRCGSGFIRAFSTATSSFHAGKVRPVRSGLSAAPAARSGRHRTAFSFNPNAHHRIPTSSHHLSLMSTSNSMALRMSSSSSPDTTIVGVCQQKIKDALQATDVKVTGAYDDPNGSHISIEVTSSMFQGKRPVQRQQLVYKAIWEELQGPVHAVDSMVCKTPEE